ncbi:MAG: bifunctional ADP-dependent NAD(P)H-hydrate dehydratase/NAD(P)H-hydrate epimerase, partial [Anaerolineae bacterium]|nr:bifunctional ADP-dependent NAD(P)H-hydrate dehydratase/NAD(P)H-hydrate epimerase [Anaerolineae bacterium]
MAAIVTIEQMQAIEQAADANGHTYAVMMALAGRAVADRVIQLVAGIADPQITVLVGSGNNGGDGLVAGRLLKEELGDTTVTAFLLRPRPESDDVFTQANGAGVVMVEGADDKAAGYKTLQNLVASADVVIDALFGTSLRLPIRGDASKVLQTVNEALAKNRADRSRASVVPVAGSDLYEDDDPHPVVVAVDCPSGLHCDSGELDKHTIRADETITFAAAKPGLLTFPGAEKVGRLFIGDIGLPDDLPPLADITLSLVVPSDVGARLPERPLNSHKGTFGKTMVVAGSLNYIGAAYLAAHAAYRVGTGLVTVGAPQIIVPALAAMLPEATWLLL